MGLTDAEQKFYDQNGYVLKKGLIPPDEISHIEREIAGLHGRMAENAPDSIGISWEEFEDEHLPKRIRQLMHSEVISEGLNRALRCGLMFGYYRIPDWTKYLALSQQAIDESRPRWHGNTLASGLRVLETRRQSAFNGKLPTRH